MKPTLAEAKLLGDISEQEVAEFVEAIVGFSNNETCNASQEKLVRDFLKLHSRRVLDYERRRFALLLLKENDGGRWGVRGPLVMARRILASYGMLPNPRRPTSAILKQVDEAIRREEAWRVGWMKDAKQQD